MVREVRIITEKSGGVGTDVNGGNGVPVRCLDKSVNTEVHIAVSCIHLPSFSWFSDCSLRHILDHGSERTKPYCPSIPAPARNGQTLMCRPVSIPIHCRLSGVGICVQVTPLVDPRHIERTVLRHKLQQSTSSRTGAEPIPSFPGFLDMLGGVSRALSGPQAVRCPRA